MSKFAHVQIAPPDAILHTAVLFNECTDPKKVNLGIGAYRDNNGKPIVFGAVRKAEDIIVSERLNKEYSGIDGIVDLQVPTQKLIFGENHPAIAEKKICSLQSLSGTGALRICGEFLFRNLENCRYAYVSDPTWANHPNIFSACGFEVRKLPYWDAEKKIYSHEAYIKNLMEAPEGSLVIFHACAHNPTGIDPTKEQWDDIIEVVSKKNLFPLMDSAYQGFASGCVDADAYSIRKMCEKVPNVAVCQSFAKNMGLYGERIGMIHILCSSQKEQEAVRTQIRLSARENYSSPPLHGARIVSKILNTPELKQDWLNELKSVSDRILYARTELRKRIEQLNVPGTWNHITDQIGMFSYTGLTPTQCERMIEKWKIFLIRNGRISLAGLNEGNLDYVAQAVADSVHNA